MNADMNPHLFAPGRFWRDFSEKTRERVLKIEAIDDEFVTGRDVRTDAVEKIPRKCFHDGVMYDDLVTESPSFWHVGAW